MRERDWHGEIRQRLERAALPPTREAEIVDELAQHLQEEYERAMASGLPEEQAKQRALSGLSDNLSAELKCLRMPADPEPSIAGGPATNVAADFWQDLRYAARMFRKNPGFTALAVLSVALGIGGNTAMFNIMSAVLFRPLPYSDPARLVQASNTGFYPPGGVVALQHQSRTMDIAGFRPGVELNITGDGQASRATGSSVSANLFTVLGVAAESGRTFRAGEDQPGRDNLLILSHALWQDRFSGDPHIVGRMITVGGIGREVVGVMPPGFAFPVGARFWIPLHLDARDQTAYWAQEFMPVIGRVRAQATLAQAQHEIQSLSREMISLYPYPMGRNFNAEATVIPLQEFLVSNVRTRLIVLQCAIGLVLLIACANVANLLLARASSRQKEIALRTALGAARDRIVRQLLTESLLLAALGGVTGIALATWGGSVLKLVVPAGAVSWSDFHIGWQVVVLAGGLSVVTGLVFGLAPAYMAFGTDLTGLIKTGGQRSTGTARARFRSGLIVAEIAVAVVLSVGAGLLIRSLWKLGQVNPGFEPEHVLTLRISPDGASCREPAACISFYDELLRRVRAIPGIYDVAAANTVPLSDKIPTIPVEIEGHPYVPSERTAPLFWAGAVTPEYFRLMRIPILTGRPLTDADSRKATPVLVINAATADRYWPGKNPVGKHIRLVFDNAWRTVVGVAGDVRQYDVANRTREEIPGSMYMPYSQSVASDRRIPAAMTLVIRTGADPADVANGVTNLVRNLNPNVPVSEIRTMASFVDASTQQSRSMASLFACFAGVALLLAAIGAYGVVSWSTTQRTFEIGLRVALGAPRRSVFALVLGQSIRLVAVGLTIGVAASFVLTRALGSFLYATAAWDAFTFSCVSLLLLAVAIIAGFVPAQRAAGVDPVTALRIE